MFIIKFLLIAFSNKCVSVLHHQQSDSVYGSVIENLCLFATCKSLQQFFWTHKTKKIKIKINIKTHNPCCSTLFFCLFGSSLCMPIYLYIWHNVTGFTKIPKMNSIYEMFANTRLPSSSPPPPLLSLFFFSHAHNVTRLWRLTRSTKLLNVQSVCGSNKWVNLILLCVHCCFVVFFFGICSSSLLFIQRLYFVFCCCPSFFFSFMPFGLPKWPVSLTDTLHSLSIHLASFFLLVFVYLNLFVLIFCVAVAFRLVHLFFRTSNESH